MIPAVELLGRTEKHLLPVEQAEGLSPVLMHCDVLEPWAQLQRAAREAGFNLQIASGFRSFERQLMIWNNKCLGVRPTYDHLGGLLDLTRLTSVEKVMAILRWSALPGGSRHHWGTDCDIYDAAAIDENYQLQLQPEEYLGDGPFAPMMRWLASYLEHNNTPDFYFPYFNFSGTSPSDSLDASGFSLSRQGVAPEPWHMSYRPVACQFEASLNVGLLRGHLDSWKSEPNMEEKVTLLANLDTIYARFIQLHAR